MRGRTTPSWGVWGVSGDDEFRTTIFLRVIPSARKHAVDDEDIRHAVRNAITMSAEGEDRILWIGPSRTGDLLEVITVQMQRGEGNAIHAMPLRRRYEYLLEGSR